MIPLVKAKIRCKNWGDLIGLTFFFNEKELDQFTCHSFVHCQHKRIQTKLIQGGRGPGDGSPQSFGASCDVFQILVRMSTFPAEKFRVTWYSHTGPSRCTSGQSSADNSQVADEFPLNIVGCQHPEKRSLASLKKDMWRIARLCCRKLNRTCVHPTRVQCTQCMRLTTLSSHPQQEFLLNTLQTSLFACLFFGSGEGHVLSTCVLFE